MQNINIEKLIFNADWCKIDDLILNINDKIISRKFLRTGLYKAIGYSKKIKICAAYCIFHIDSGYGYAGSTGHLGKRLNTHRTMLNTNNHDNANIQNAFNSSDKQLFDILIFFTKDREEAYEIEQILINILKDNNCAFNNSSDARVGLRSKSWTDEERKILSKRMSERIVSNETRKKLSIACKNKLFSDETRKKMSISASSENRKKRMIDLAIKSRKRISVNGTEYESITEASKKLNIRHNTLSYRLISNSFINKNYFYI